MEANRILSSSLLDLVFDNRNKEYGAYELRVTYPERIKRALIFVFIFLLLIIAGTLLASKLKPSSSVALITKEFELQQVQEEEKPPPVVPPPPRQEPPQQIEMKQFTPPVIVDDDKVEEPPPAQPDLSDVKIDIKNQEGIPDDGIVKPGELDGNKGIIEESKTKSDEPFRSVEVEAKFEGDWSRFLLKNLRGEIPVGNGAAVGKYRVAIEFVVDVDGSVSNIKPVSNNGYGMEEEAVRVLKKAAKWRPGIQNGIPVKAYHTQIIVFDVQEN
ncbi:MAG: energy transducer TonB [Chitinophagaceae bacterium]